MKISLQDNTIKKILREQFQGETPIIKRKYGSEQKMLISEIKQKFNTLARFSLSTITYSRYTQDELAKICFFNVQSSSQYYYDQEFRLKFNNRDELIIESGYWTSSPVYQLEQIYTLDEKVELECKRLEKGKLKNLKIKTLKHKAITAKINQIAKEDQLEIRTKEYATKIKLFVRLAKFEEIEIDIPYSQFQDTLKNLRLTIQTLRELRDSGITFKIRTTSREKYWHSFKE